MKKLFIVFAVWFVFTPLQAQENLKAKYVFFFIGDGMGISQVNATEAYLADKDGYIGVKKLEFTKFPNVGLVTTYAKDRYITDSAAAGTALSTGNKTSVETIGMDASRKKKFKNMAEMAKEAGMRVGIISTVNMNDATPSTFYAHQAERSMLKEIANDLLNSNFDFFGGGWVQKADIRDALIKKGYVVSNDKHSFGKLKKGVEKAYAVCPVLDKDQACRYSIDQGSREISLKEFVSKAVDLLDNPKGFFIMAEAGKIDWANHTNDIGAAIKDVIALNDAVKEAVKFYNKHPKETLIVVTTDHETGGFAQGTYKMAYSTDFKLLGKQKVSAQVLEDKIADYKKNHSMDKANIKDLAPYLKSNFGLNDDDIKGLEPYFHLSIAPKTKEVKAIYGKYNEPLTIEIVRLVGRKAGISWTTSSHTGMPVGVFAMGNGSDKFTGYIDNTDVAKGLMCAMGVK